MHLNRHFAIEAVASWQSVCASKQAFCYRSCGFMAKCVHLNRHFAIEAEACGKDPNRKGLKNFVPRVGHNRIYTPYMTVCMVISLPITT